MPHRHLDYDSDICLAEHQSQADRKAGASTNRVDCHGNHACGNCPATSAGNHRRHNLTKFTIGRYAERADLCAGSQREPQTHTLLINQFTKEECRRLFPKVITIAYKKERDRIIAMGRSSETP